MLGSDSEVATVYISTAAPAECAFTFRQGQIDYEDRKTGSVRTVSPGTVIPVGTARVIVQGQLKTPSSQPAASAKVQRSKEQDAGQATEDRRASTAPGGSPPAGPGGGSAADLRMLRLSNGTTIKVFPGQRLSASDLGLLGGSNVFAEISRHPQDPSVVGLRNLSQSTWTVENREGRISEVEPSRSAKLEPGSTIVVPGGILVVV